MDPCVLDIVVEFLGVAFHGILYYASVYPESIFETRKKYSVLVYRSIHPEVNKYIDLCLKNIKECLNSEELSRVEFVVTNHEYKSLMRFVFDFNKKEYYDDTVDAYLIQIEQSLRAFCLSLKTLTSKFKELPEDCSFCIYLHTNESKAVAIASNPDFEDFPLVELEENVDESGGIIPIRSLSLRSYNIDTYVEF